MIDSITLSIYLQWSLESITAVPQSEIRHKLLKALRVYNV